MTGLEGLPLGDQQVVKGSVTQILTWPSATLQELLAAISAELELRET